MQSSFHIKKISWQETIPLRHSVLWPNKDETFCHVKGDDSAVHYGVFIDNILVSVASLYLLDNTVRLRKFATAQSHQGQGIGSALLKHMIDETKQRKAACFWCDARETAIGFYQCFGLKVEGELFNKADVPYFKMKLYF